MIRNHDRSRWFGASDAYYIMGNWNTTTFLKWWMVKSGASKSHVSTRAMAAGTAYEHRILSTIGVKSKDRQIRMPEIRLRVNLDGETHERIKEVKTTKDEPRVSKRYWQQAQIQMYAAQKPVDIVFYRMTEAEYENFFLPIDRARLKTVQVEYDSDFIEADFLPRLKYLAYCLDRKTTPRMEEFNEGKWLDRFDWRGWLHRIARKARRIVNMLRKRTL